MFVKPLNNNHNYSSIEIKPRDRDNMNLSLTKTTKKKTLKKISSYSLQREKQLKIIKKNYQ